MVLLLSIAPLIWRGEARIGHRAVVHRCVVAVLGLFGTTSPRCWI